MSAATDALKKAVEAANEALESGLVDVEALRSALTDAASEGRAAIQAANEAIELALKRCEPDSEGMLDGEEIAQAIQALGGAHSGVSGPLDDLGGLADSLESAADDVTTMTTDALAAEGAP
jgi:hypothetical protein